MHACMHSYIHTHTQTYIHIYIYIYTHAHLLCHFCQVVLTLCECRRDLAGVGLESTCQELKRLELALAAQSEDASAIEFGSWPLWSLRGMPKTRAATSGVVSAEGGDGFQPSIPSKTASCLFFVNCRLSSVGRSLQQNSSDSLTPRGGRRAGLDAVVGPAGILDTEPSIHAELKSHASPVSCSPWSEKLHRSEARFKRPRPWVSRNHVEGSAPPPPSPLPLHKPTSLAAQFFGNTVLHVDAAGRNPKASRDLLVLRPDNSAEDLQA